MIKKFLKELGNPYYLIALDVDGKSSVSFGIYGIPESILINKELKVIKKYIYFYFLTIFKASAEYSQFIVISLVGLAINSFVLWILTDKLKFNFYIAKLGAIGVTTVWNFFANYLYTFA